MTRAAEWRSIGITNVVTAAPEDDEFADVRLQSSLTRAEAAVDALVDRLLAGKTEDVAA